ncbi:hypothetical protein T492DRAFT_1106281 [Pavlovales sp. CCMP2436]|nr:hypothetical protein T492DRAFT_1106281 [Pavlovales sp. CCMP2436]
MLTGAEFADALILGALQSGGSPAAFGFDEGGRLFVISSSAPSSTTTRFPAALQLAPTGGRGPGAPRQRVAPYPPTSPHAHGRRLSGPGALEMQLLRDEHPLGTQPAPPPQLRRSASQNDQSFCCPYCKVASFTVKEELTSHIRACGLSYNCACGQRFQTRAKLVRHCRRCGHEPWRPQGAPHSHAHSEPWQPVSTPAGSFSSGLSVDAAAAREEYGDSSPRSPKMGFEHYAVLAAGSAQQLRIQQQQQQQAQQAQQVQQQIQQQMQQMQQMQHQRMQQQQLQQMQQQQLHMHQRQQQQVHAQMQMQAQQQQSATQWPQPSSLPPLPRVDIAELLDILAQEGGESADDIDAYLSIGLDAQTAESMKGGSGEGHLGDRLPGQP